jgi:cytochrome P450
MTETTSSARTWPFERADPLPPPPEFAELRERCPVSHVELWDGSCPVLFTRYSDIREVLGRPEISSDVNKAGFPQSSETIARARAGQASMARMDPPRHDEHRRMLAAEFMFRNMEQLRPYLEELVDGLLDVMEETGPPVDLVPALATALPANAICRLLDLPEDDSDFFQDRVATWMSLDSAPDVAAEAGADAVRYFEDLVARRESEVRDGRSGDLVSGLIEDQVFTGKLTSGELAHMLHLLLVGGFDTTANMIALGVITFSRHPDQLAEMRDDPSLVPGAVEELLRYISVAHHVAFRLATADIEVGGHCVKAGEGVIAPLPAANYDPDVFPNPEEFDIHRDARRHMAFGFGLHQCLGQHLARLELNVVFERLYRRFPNLELAIAEDEIRFKNSMIYGVEELPVSW